MDGRKRFEIRDNRDRGFQSGDEVELSEFDPSSPNVLELQKYTGRYFLGVITYVLGFEQKEGWVVFGFEPLIDEPTK